MVKHDKPFVDGGLQVSRVRQTDKFKPERNLGLSLPKGLWSDNKIGIIKLLLMDKKNLFGILCKNNNFLKLSGLLVLFLYSLTEPYFVQLSLY